MGIYLHEINQILAIKRKNNKPLYSALVYSLKVDKSGLAGLPLLITDQRATSVPVCVPVHVS